MYIVDTVLGDPMQLLDIKIMFEELSFYIFLGFDPGLFFDDPVV